MQEPRHDVEIESLTQSSSMNRLLNDCVYCACLFHCLIFLQPFFVFELDDAIKYLQVLPNLVVNSAGNFLNPHPVDLTLVPTVESVEADVREHEL